MKAWLWDGLGLSAQGDGVEMRQSKEVTTEKEKTAATEIRERLSDWLKHGWWLLRFVTARRKYWTEDGRWKG